MPLDLRVLIVEDIPTDAELAVRQLERSDIGYVHHRVDSEPAFRKALTDFRPHLILSDFTIPAFDGLAALDIALESAPDCHRVLVEESHGNPRIGEAHGDACAHCAGADDRGA